MVMSATEIVSRPSESALAKQHAAERPELLTLLRNTPGPIYSENMVLLLEAGKEVFAEPAIMTVLSAAGTWDERPFLEMLAHREFPLILASDLDGGRYSPASARAIRANYEKIKELDSLGVYRPRP